MLTLQGNDPCNIGHFPLSGFTVWQIACNDIIGTNQLDWEAIFPPQSQWFQKKTSPERQLLLSIWIVLVPSVNNAHQPISSVTALPWLTDGTRRHSVSKTGKSADRAF